MAKYVSQTGMYRTTRKFDGKVYKADRVTSSKMEAGMIAKALRTKGYKVRIVYTKTFGYVVYVRK